MKLQRMNRLMNLLRLKERITSGKVKEKSVLQVKLQIKNIEQKLGDYSFKELEQIE